MVKLDCMRLPSPMVPAMPHTFRKLSQRATPELLFIGWRSKGRLLGMAAGIYKALFGDVPTEQSGRHVSLFQRIRCRRRASFCQVS